MDPMGRSKDEGADLHKDSVTDPTVTLFNPSAIEVALARAKKKLIEEDFIEARSIVNTLLRAHPDLSTALSLRDQIQQASAKLSTELFDQGSSCYMECDWDRAISFWKKSLLIVPDEPKVVEWIGKAQRKLEQEKIVRSGLLKELEKCGKMLSERNYVVAEEHLDELKNRFTNRYRLADLQRIYEALVVRTRVELEKEFEDLRSNVFESAPPDAAVVTAEKPVPSGDSKASEGQLQRQYMDAFEAGRKFFENGEWHKAVSMWQTARRLNPQDINLTHWIALAENNAIQHVPYAKPSPVRGTFVFLSVFVLTAAIAYLGYRKFADYQRETKNRILVQRAIEHYRMGRLEESWKTLQIYVLHDPENESARTLLERITAEMNARQKAESQGQELGDYLRMAREQRDGQNYAGALEFYSKVIEMDPAHREARQQYDQLRKLATSTEASQKIAALLHEAEELLRRKQLNPAQAKLELVKSLDPGNSKADALIDRIESERSDLNRLAVQLEIARYLYERNQKESAKLVLTRILATDPGQPQAKQMLSTIQRSSSAPKAPVEIRVQPPARVWIDGRDLGVNSYFRQNEPIGHHIIHIELAGFNSVDQVIEIKRSAKNDFHFRLTPK